MGTSCECTVRFTMRCSRVNMLMWAMGLSVLSFAFCLAATITPRFYHSSEDAGNGCKSDIGYGVASRTYNLNCGSSEVESWDNRLNNDCNDWGSLGGGGLRSCCMGRKASF